MRPATANATLILLTVLVVVSACKKHHDVTPTKTTTDHVDVYVLGTSNDTLEYWKNDSAVPLASTTGLAN
jgi:hypothetical protein